MGTNRATRRLAKSGARRARQLEALDALGLTVDDFEAIEAAAQEAARLTGEPPARIGLQMVLGAIERKRTRTDSNDKAANPQTSR
jgi:hypothetical protein